jgi:hypothetical protein
MDTELHAYVTNIVQAHIAAIPRPYEGIIVPGSWQAAYGTVTVKKASTAALPPDSAIGQIVMKDVVLLAPAYLDQGAPVGGERCIVMPFHGGLGAYLLHEEDDSPGAPSGERWIGHKSGSTIKLKNSGDVSTTAHGAHNVTAASSTHVVSGSATRTVSGNEAHTAANYSIVATGGASMIAPSTQIGPPGGPYLNIGSGGLGGTFALVRVFELNALITAFNTHIHSGVQGGPNNSGTPTAPATFATGSTDVTAG